MKYKNRVLWIEDEAALNMQRYATPVLQGPDYDLTLAVTISEAVLFLQQEFDAIVVDLRMPPGVDRNWIALDQQLALSSDPPHLGLHLLLNLFLEPKTGYEVELPKSIVWKHSIKKFGVLSIDPHTDVKDDLGRINFKENYYRQKQAGMPINVLLNLVERICRQAE
jgi:hypothetical protein